MSVDFSDYGAEGSNTMRNAESADVTMVLSLAANRTFYIVLASCPRKTCFIERERERESSHWRIENYVRNIIRVRVLMNPGH